MTKQAQTMGPSRILLTCDSKGWVAQYYGPLAAEIVELFGTDKLPTAYSKECEGWTVLAGIRSNNPKVIVELGGAA